METPNFFSSLLRGLPKRLRSKRGLVWLGAFVVCLVAGLWTGEVYRERSARRGETLVQEAASLLESARASSARGEAAGAERDLEKALALLKSTEKTRAHAAYLSVLVDLASVKLSRENPSPEALGAIRALLAEAWDLGQKAEPALRARIARDRGLTDLLDGKPAEARSWYQAAADLAPEDEAARARMKLIGRIER